jgi:hypothetical protein
LSNIVKQLLYSPHSFSIIILYYLVGVILFLIPGLIIANILLKRNYIEDKFVLFCSLGISCFWGYLFFWIYYFSPFLGRMCSILIFICIILCFIFSSIRKSIFNSLNCKEVYIPVLLMLVIGVYYLSTLYMGSDGQHAYYSKGFIADRLGAAAVGKTDYLIQKIMADTLYCGNTIWNLVLAPSSGSTLADRPPVLGGITLIYYHIFPMKLFYYTAISTVASMIWVPAVWSLCRISKLSVLYSIVLILAISQTGFFFSYSIGCGHKLLAGSLAIGTFILLVLRPYLNKIKISRANVIIASIFASLSFLCHFSIGIMILSIALILLTPKLFPGIASIIIGATVFLALTSPYLVLKNYYEPNTSNLLRQVVVVRQGKGIFHDKKLSLYDAAVKSYSQLSLKEVIENKINNIRSLLRPPMRILKLKLNKIHKYFRFADTWGIIKTMGIFNMAWLLFFLPFFIKNDLHEDAINASNIMIFTGLMILFLSTMIYFNKYIRLATIALGAIVLLFVGLAIKITTLNKWVPIILLSINSIYFYFVWVLVLPYENLHINWSMVFIHIIALAGLIVIPVRFKNAK